MKRRQLLQYGLGLAATSVIVGCSKSLEKAGMNHESHNMNDMSGMNHDMSDMNKEMGTMASEQLMSPSKLVKGAPLATLPLLANISKQSNTFKASITAGVTKKVVADNKETEFWLYNDTLGGQQIVVTEGDTVEINFRNELPQPTTIHWHGLDVPVQSDGNPQDPIMPGQSKTYTFTLPEGSAGTYWYHPHPHEHVSEQVYKGLAGTLIVRAKNDPLASLKEQHWLISDLRLAADGHIPANNMNDWMNGREGEIVLINGQYQPKITLQGDERIRIWNATSARYLRLNIPGVKWIVIGTEGGLLESPRPAVDELFLAPAERVEVIVQGVIKNATPLQSLYYNRQKMMVQENPTTLTLATVGTQGKVARLPSKLRTIPAWGDVKARKKIVFNETMNAMNHGTASAVASTPMMSHNMSNMSMENGMHSMMSSNSSTQGQASSDLPPSMMTGMFTIDNKVFDMKRIDLTSRVGEVEEWEIQNASHMDHPFHLHGTQFEVIRKQWQGKTETASFRALKDVVNLRPNETVWIRTKQNHAGLRMYHCHILEHEDLGMMGSLKVIGV